MSKLGTKWFFMFFAVICSRAGGAWAVPAISGVSGVLATGQALTVTGSDMAYENSASWLVSQSAAGFEGAQGLIQGVQNADGWIAEDLNDPNNDGGYVTDIRLMGTKSAWFQARTVCQATPSCGANRIYRDLNRGTQGTYLAGYVRWDGTWPAEYCKMMITIGGSNQFYLQPLMPGSGNPTAMLLKHGGDTRSVTLPKPIEKNMWHYFEVYWQEGSPATYNFWWDGMAGTYWQPANAGVQLTYLEIGVPNYSGTTSGNHLDVWYDRFVISTERIYQACRVDVGTSTVYGQGNEKYQSPEFISDTSVRVKLDLAGLGSGPYYLWVTNNRQERSTAYLLDGTDTTPPAAPSGLSVR